jgi:hypothetical protein
VSGDRILLRRLISERAQDPAFPSNQFTHTPELWWVAATFTMLATGFLILWFVS